MKVGASLAAALSACALAVPGLAQHAAVTVVDANGQPLSNVALYVDGPDAGQRKVDVHGATVTLEDLGSKAVLRVEHPTYGVHAFDVDLAGGTKFTVDLILTGDDALAKVRPVVAPALSLGHGLRDVTAVGVNGANACSSASAIGSGSFAFDTTGATTDGVPDALCLSFGNDDVANDVWYLYTSDCDGDATIDTCSNPTFDTRLAAYDAGACPTGGGILACDDDSCGLQSSITFSVASGSSYLIRVGGFGATDAGTGTLTVSCAGASGGGCATATSCQAPNLATGFTSNDVGSIFTLADNFSPTADGAVTDVCWWGVGFDGFGDCAASMSDDFTITYYADDGNGVCPGTLKAGPFPVTATRTATGNVLLGVFAELQWGASHAPVPVTAGECCWIEIKNSDASCFFAWEASAEGDGRNCQTDVTVGAGASTGSDVAFCLNVDFDNTNCVVTGPTNDLCADAEPIAGEGVFAYDNTGAGTDGPAHAVCDFFTDGGNTDNDIWYCWTAPCTSEIRFETCGINTTDTKLNVYDGCGMASDVNLLACNDDDCALQSGLIFNAVAGNSYKLRVGNFPTESPGAGSFSLSCVSTPSNDRCEDAIAVAVPSTTSGSTTFATIDFAPSCNGVALTAPGVWYSVTGTGNTMTASTCSSSELDTKLSVLCGDCADVAALTCVAANDDACGLQSEVSWCSQSGTDYLILVHGFGTASGNFTLSVFEDGASCSGAVSCQDEGACCVGSFWDVCVIATPADCASMGGLYLGDQTVCSGYSASACINPFQDISGTGTALVLGDDAGQVVPIGFDFLFFEVTHDSIAVCSNGYLTFGDNLTAFTETAIPNPATPNDLIAPLWNDFSPDQGGTIHYQTQGPVGNRCFIAQWTDVPQFNQSDANTFQAVLFEADYSIHFRYGTVSIDGVGSQNGTVGIEGPDGFDGLQWTTGVEAGDCAWFDYKAACPVAECGLVFATSTGDETFSMDGHIWNTQLADIQASYPVWLDDIPQFQIPPFVNLPHRWGNIRNLALLDVPWQSWTTQIVMWNPEVFPSNPEQSTDVIHVTVWLSGRVDVARSGTADGMSFQHEVVETAEGSRYLRFPFSIDGF